MNLGISAVDGLPKKVPGSVSRGGLNGPVWIAAVFLSAIVLWVFFPLSSPHPFAYDESDYMWAGTRGTWANYTDQHGLTIVDFVRRGLDLYHNPQKRASFSQFIRASGDIGMYRHYHGPMYAYWIAVVHKTGVTEEQIFRGSGLLIHVATALVILFGIRRILPDLPQSAALIGCTLFLFSRPALSAATSITQHVLFTFWSVSALFAASMFFRKYENRWLYITAGLLAACFATVETSVLLVIGLAAALAVDHRRVRERWPAVRSFLISMAKATAIFSLVLTLIWPKAIFHGAVVKGFLQLMYMAVGRKTFSPGTPLDLWRDLFLTTPWELLVLLAGITAMVILWRHFPYRKEMLPWLAFTVTFLLVTLKVTLNYTYYFTPLTTAAAVITGAAGGMMLQRSGRLVRIALPLLIGSSVLATGTEWAQVSTDIRDSRSYFSPVLEFLRGSSIPPGQPVEMPYQLVPTVHYYFPHLKTIGYDYGYRMDEIAGRLRSGASANVMLCEQPVCDAVEHTGIAAIQRRDLLHPAGPTGRPLYAMYAGQGAEE